MSISRRMAALPVALALGALAVLGACGSTYAGSTVGKQVQSWTRTSPDPKFAQAVSTLEGDFRSVVRAQGEGGSALAALRTVCDVLVTDALSANQNLPTPDAQLTQLLSRAYETAATAGDNCYCAAGGRPCPRGTSGAASERPLLLARSATERGAAESELIEAQARVDELIEQSGGSGN